MADNRNDAHAERVISEAEREAGIEAIEIEEWIDAGATSPMEMWRQIQGVEQPDTVPLTVREAAKRLNVSERSVRRRLSALEAMDPPGAYRVGEGDRAPWRIIPAALDRLREGETVRPKPAWPPRGKTKPAPKKRSPTRWEP